MANYLSMFLSCFFLMFAQNSVAQDYPVKPIRIVVPFAPGSAADFVTRLIASHLGTALREQVITDNRPGLGGAIGTEYVTKQPADGYTLLLASQGPLVIAPNLQSNLNYKVSDFVPISALVWTPQVFVVTADSPIKDIRTLIKMAKDAPGKILYGSGGNGSAQHLIMSSFASAAQIELFHVPYKGSVASVTGLAGGQISLLSDTFTVVNPFLISGRFRALGVTPNARIPQLPNVPTIDEQGVPFNIINWQLIIARSGTPANIVGRLESEIRKILSHPDISKLLFDQGFNVMTTPREEINAYVQGELKTWRTIVAGSGAKME